MNKFIALCSLVFVGGCLDAAVPSGPVDAGSDANTTTDVGQDVSTAAGCEDDGQCMDGVCTEQNVCVQCQAGDDCATGACDTTTNLCVACVDQSGCEAAEICDSETKTCVKCLDDSDCTGSVCIKGATPDLNACKECRDREQCSTALASVCDLEINTCAGCNMPEDCDHLSLNQCVAGTCIECTTQTEEDDCNRNVCDVATNTCTTTDIGDTPPLEPCVSDTACVSGNACVPVQFESVFYGNYCMPISTGSCARPFLRYDRTTVNGASVQVCLHNEDFTTPEALNAFFDECVQATDCGPKGGVCTDIGGKMVCTYACLGNTECFTSVSCGPLGNKFCGIQ